MVVTITNLIKKRLMGFLEKEIEEQVKLGYIEGYDEGFKKGKLVGAQEARVRNNPGGIYLH